MPIPSHIQQAIQAYYAERATDDDIAALEDWFREDESHVRIFAEHGMLEWQILCEHEKLDAAAIMTLLREAEENAEPDFSLLHSPTYDSPAKADEAGSRSAHDLAAVGGYALRLALTSKLAKRLYAYSAVAAIVLLAFVLFNPWADNGKPTDAPVAGQQQGDQDQSHADTTHVAKLTAEHNAVWDQQPSKHLRPGDRLTLTAGIAQVTTQRGAVVLLQAPCSVELLDNNAIYLHDGRLVGRCYTELSKGFVVRTSQGEITDIGTEFGVDVSDSRVVATVFEGKIEIASPGREPVLLVRQQTAQLSSENTNAQWVLSDQIAQGFETLRSDVFPGVLALPNTGVGLAAGEIDPSWQIIAVQGERLDQPLPLYCENAYTNLLIPESDSGWIGWQVNDHPAGELEGKIVYTCRATLSVTERFDPQAIQLALRYAVDDEIVAIRLNDQAVTLTDPVRLKQRRIGNQLIAGGFVAGTNTLEFDVINYQSPDRPKLFGLIADWRLVETEKKPTQPN